MSSVLALEQVVLVDSFSSSSSRELSLRNPLLGAGWSSTSDISSETDLIDFLDFLLAELWCRAVLLTAPGKNILEIADMIRPLQSQIWSFQLKIASLVAMIMLATTTP